MWGLVIDWLGASVNGNILHYLRPIHSDLNTTVAMALMVVVIFLAV
jgi:F0F1-type ATP synthase membrane subunit a